MTDDQQQSFIDAYVVAALWSSEPDGKTWYESDIDSETRETMGEDCIEFLEVAAPIIETATHNRAGEQWSKWDLAGHDFWLTRCGHGAGFWDGDWSEPAATLLDKLSTEAGNVDLYEGDDGKVYA